MYQRWLSPRLVRAARGWPVSQGHGSSPLFHQRTGDHREVSVAKPLLDDVLPFVSQASKRPEAVVAGRL